MGLKVETDFPGANACGISVGERDGVAEVAFTPDPHGGPEALWFHFRIARDGATPGAGQPVRVVLRHPDNMLGGDHPEALRPVMRRDGADWERQARGEVEELPDGRRQVLWKLPAPESTLEFAVCYPYGLPELSALVHETHHVWRLGIIGVSQGGRGIARLANDPGVPGGPRPGVYLIARQHSGETPGSWVLDGFLRWVAAHPDLAPLVWTVPFANVDGVEQGDYGKDNFPYDLNRAWGDPPMRHETHVIMKDLARWKARCRPAFALDFHAPGACEADGMYTFTPNPTTMPLESKEGERWAGIVGGALSPDFTAPRSNRIAYYASRWTTPNFTKYCFTALGVPALTLEVPYALCGERVLTRELYREAGGRLAAAVCRAAIEVHA